MHASLARTLLQYRSMHTETGPIVYENGEFYTTVLVYDQYDEDNYTVKKNKKITDPIDINKLSQGRYMDLLPQWPDGSRQMPDGSRKWLNSTLWDEKTVKPNQLIQQKLLRWYDSQFLTRPRDTD